VSTQLFAALGWALLHSLWLGGLAGLFYAFVRIVFRERIELRYWAAVGALAATALATAGVFIASLSGQLLTTPASAEASAISLSEMALPTATVAALQWFDSAYWTGGALPMWISWLWMIGVSISAFRLWRSHRTLHNLTQCASSDARLVQLAASLMTSMRLRFRVRIALSELIDVPCVIGVLRPIILMPAALLTRLPADQLELVVLHELTHIKNGDLWVNAMQVALEVLLFFHPAVHWISADIRALRERRCDREVLRLRATPMCYAKTLLSLEEYRHEFRGLAIAASGGDLSKRVRDIMLPRAHKLGGRRAGRGAALISAAAVSAICAAMLGYFSTPEPVVAATQTAAAALPERVAMAVLATDKPASFVVPALPVAASVIDMTPPELPSPATTQIPPRRVLRTAKLDIAARVPLALSEPLLPAINPVQPALNARMVPRLVHRVSPEFTPGSRFFYRFSLSFTLNAQGHPQNITLASGSAAANQIAAAKTALAQWRFDPVQSAEQAGAEFDQAFSFKEIRNRQCAPVVGTRICRS
jgi:bla regulator protein blaR1